MNHEEQSETLRTALKAALRVTGQTSLVVTDNGADALYVTEYGADALYVTEYKGKAIDLECDNTGVIVIKLAKGMRNIKSLSGDITAPVILFSVWYPKYGSGCDPYWFTDDTLPCDETFIYVEALAETVALYYVKQNIACAMESDLLALEANRSAEF